MDYDQEDDPIGLGKEEEPAKPSLSMSRKVTAYSAMIAVGAGSVAHGAHCEPSSLMKQLICKPGISGRHHPHIEMGGNTSSSSGTSVVLISTAMGTAIDSSLASDWTFTPKSR